MTTTNLIALAQRGIKAENERIRIGCTATTLEQEDRDSGKMNGLERDRDNVVRTVALMRAQSLDELLAKVALHATITQDEDHIAPGGYDLAQSILIDIGGTAVLSANQSAIAA